MITPPNAARPLTPFASRKGSACRRRAVVEFAFFVEETDADWAGFERALKAKGFTPKRLKDGETVLASRPGRWR